MTGELIRGGIPRDAAIDRMMVAINGTTAPDPHRFGFMSRERSNHTFDLFKAAWDNPITEDDAPDNLKKSVTTATGLTWYDLRAPALNLFPTVTPLRNSIARNQRTNPGTAVNWRAVLSTQGSGWPYMGWVPEGRRSPSMAYQTASRSAAYVTLGEEDSLTEEARFAARGLEDEDAMVQLRLLLKMFVKEEAGILGGNASLALGVPATPVLSSAGTGGTLATGTYSVIVVGLTEEGLLNSSLAGGLATVQTFTGNDAKTYVLNGGASNKSTGATIAVTLGAALSASVTVLNGAVAYGWYAGAVGSEKLQAITTINSWSVNVPLATTTQAASVVAADYSQNANYAFDGLMTTTFNPANNAYVVAQPTGTPGTGTPLTSSGAGSINEIDTMLKSMWDTNRVSVTVLYVNSQELKNITAKVLNGASAPLLRYTSTNDQAGTVEYKLTAAGVVAFYFNPYTADGGVKIPIKIHPNLAAGTLIGWAETLPPWYVSNAVPEVAMIQTRQDYYAEIWPKTSREQFYGIYTQEVLAVYAPFAMGIITNIGNG